MADIKRRLSIVLFLLLAIGWPRAAFATWSIVAADRATGRIVIASATCADITAAFLHHLQAVIVPDRGVAACQAMVDISHQDQALIARELEKGTDPAEIVRMLRANAAFPRRQFGIVDLAGRAAGATGPDNGGVAEDRQGTIPGTQIVYSIQGNLLRPGDVVARAVRALVDTPGTLTDRVMAAMEAADAAGGDSRCGCPPDDTIRCDGRTSSLAYIAMAERGARPGQLALFIPVSQAVAHGGPEWIHLEQGDSFNPVRTLRRRYDRWRASQPAAANARP